MKHPSKKIYINGRFLTQGLTGVQRVAHEMVLALDKLLAKGGMPEPLQNIPWTVLTPRGKRNELPLKKLSIQEVGCFGGHAWEQIDLFVASLDGTLLSFGNSGPILHPSQFVMIHDACVYRHPEFFSTSYQLLHRTLGKILARSAVLGTVSKFSQRELGEILNIPTKDIGMFYNGADHMCRITPDTSILDKFELRSHSYFLCIGSLTKNKNVQIAVDAFLKLNRPDLRLVIVGGGNKAVFGTEEKQQAANVIQTGRLNDEEIAGLFTTAQAFVFPSIYEGFGLPPLEGMHYGCPVLATNARAVQEVCGDAAVYFDAKDANALILLMQAVLDGRINRTDLRSKQQARLEQFTWQKSAARLAQFIYQKT